MIIIKSEYEIAIMREANRILAQLFEHISPMILPGISTIELDKEAELFIRSHGALPAFKGYRDYPATLCTSVNDEVVHGIPGPRVLQSGDIISIDVGALFDGFYSDAARTFPVGTISPQAKKLIEVTRESLDAGISQAVPGNHLSDISAAVQKVVEEGGFSVVRDFVGHGIGRNLHEAPQIPNFGRRGKGPVLQEGMTLAIEPMVNAGTYKVLIQSDGWTAVTEDASLSAHFENSIAVTKDGPVVLSAL
ncbi:MAG TPA: type I methionyl aminopeptidase [Deltaproteobacteria bacterium]|jgi:methionyl aminopeptidase|nr:type I methionyl aminopeptidase [Deltaproteobacteria bacterium]MDI9542235.1 type I methionyl aminopeptidase [Pseudomonadota bacterium]NLW67464.1 type I methionyl aminopeptidase [Bacteriovoracaceae bacterium]HNU75200.1 type I methionyl aminopeptidase [Deltaproteobacteria bacterium]HOE72173.1 type I methionyl aminopeptidase [Deltaproteobacteria bacterium]